MEDEMIKTIDTLPSERLFEREACGTRFEFRDNAILGPTVSIRIEGGGGGQAAYVAMPLEDLQEVMRRATAVDLSDGVTATAAEATEEDRIIPPDATGLILMDTEETLNVRMVYPEGTPGSAIAEVSRTGDASSLVPSIGWGFVALGAVLDGLKGED